MKKLSDIEPSQLTEFLQCTTSFTSQLQTGKKKCPADKAILISERFGVPLWKIRPDIYPRHLFEANDASESNQQQRPTELGANV
jgi:DNA-binding transcriptional regulator YdaS (Cro superfamily)